MSMGMHRLWKRFAISMADVRPGQRVLDVASGSGDLALAFARRAGPTGQVVMTDINDAMLAVGRDKVPRSGQVAPPALCNGEKLPFPDDTFDCVTIAFGLRNFTNKDRGLAEMARVTRPGGPRAGARVLQGVEARSRSRTTRTPSRCCVAGQARRPGRGRVPVPAESIRRHPDQETLKGMMWRRRAW